MTGTGAETKRGRLDTVLAERGLAAVWFARPGGFGWLTGGDNVVDRSGGVGVAAAGYDGDGLTVVTNNVEGPRLRAEELPGFDGIDGAELRQPLVQEDVERFRTLGSETAAVVEAVCRAAAPGKTERDAFAAIRDAYGSLGHPDEWREHHQGGAAGYAGREWIATPDSATPLDLPMAYAWNPTVDGAKSEDTVLVSDDGFEPLTATDEWPTREVEAVGFDLTLHRPDVLWP